MMRMTRRQLMAGIGRNAAGAGVALAWPGACLRAQTRDAADPLTVGIVTEESGENARLGLADRRGITLAIAAANRAGGILDRRIAAVSLDTQTRPGYVARTLPGFIKHHGLSCLIGGTSAGVADAVAAAAQDVGIIYLDTNSRASTAAGACRRSRFSWSAGRERLARATVVNVHQVFGRRWLLIVAENVWGRHRAEFQRRLIEAAGGTVAGEVPIPADGTRLGFALDAVDSVRPDAVFPAVDLATLGWLTIGARQRANAESPAWVVPAPDWPTLAGKRPEDFFGVFPLTWYWRLERRGVPDFVKTYWRAFPDAEPRMPGSFVYNGYMAARSLFEAIARAGSAESPAIVRELEGTRYSAAQRLQNGEAWMDAATHTLRQPVYLATANPKPRHREDLFHLLNWAAAGEGSDPAAEKCGLDPTAADPGGFG